LSEAAQQITDKISISGAIKIKRIEAKISNNIRKMRFNNNSSALIFGSFHQGKEQRSHFNNKSSFLTDKRYSNPSLKTND
jgi:hypothetical protein